MALTTRPLAAALFLIFFSALLLDRAQAGSGHYYPPVTDKLTQDECGSCHMAFPAALLPARSWQRIMGGLADHFGDDASLDPAATAHITRYLTDNAADGAGSRHARKLMRGIDQANPPLRITELPKWVSEHREISPREWKSKDVGSKANCTACHVDASKGYFEDD